MEFKDRLKYLLDNVEVNGSKVSTYRIGKESGLSRVSYENYMNGKQKPSIENAIIIARYFKISIEWLLTGEGDIKPSENIPSSDIVLHLKEELKELRTKNEELNREIGYLEGQLKEIKKLVPKEESAICATASGSTSEK